MAKFNISFNGKNFFINESSFATAYAELKSHLSTVMNGTGATITLDGITYNIDATKLTAAEDSFAAYLDTIGGGDEPIIAAAGLYETGSSYTVMKKSWQELLDEGVVHVEDGMVYTNFDMELGQNNSSSALAGDLALPNDGSITQFGDFDINTFSGHMGFGMCLELTGVIIPNSVSYINEWAFVACPALSSVFLPNSITIIGSGAFRYSNSLQFINIPNSVTTISAQAFEESGLTTINIENATIIDYAAFRKCRAATSITIIGNGQTTIGQDAFSHADNLITATIGNGVITIDSSAFYYCGKLNSVTIGNNVTTIDSYAFDTCPSLTSIIFEGTTQQWNAIAKGDRWNRDVPATEVICSDGTVAL